MMGKIWHGIYFRISNTWLWQAGQSRSKNENNELYPKIFIFTILVNWIVAELIKTQFNSLPEKNVYLSCRNPSHDYNYLQFWWSFFFLIFEVTDNNQKNLSLVLLPIDVGVETDKLVSLLRGAVVSIFSIVTKRLQQFYQVDQRK